MTKYLIFALSPCYSDTKIRQLINYSYLFAVAAVFIGQVKLNLTRFLTGNLPLILRQPALVLR